MTDDVQWQPVIGTAEHVPFSGERTGKAGVAEFFKIVGETEEFQQFETRVHRAGRQGRGAHYRAVTKLTGRTFDSDFVMVFTLRDGKVAAFREFTNTAAVNAAFA